MGRLYFGKSEDVTCIVDVAQKAPDGRDLCLAYKTTTYWLGAGVWVADDGHVLRIRDGASSYYELPEAAREGRVEGIPHPLPAYRISAGTYFEGLSLWWVIAATVAWYVGLARWRRRKQSTLLARMEAAPLDRGPPRMDTEGDRKVRELVLGQLLPGEQVQHQAYAVAWNYAGEKAGDDAFFLVLTNQTLLRLETRPGAFTIVYEANAVTALPRDVIADVRVDHGNVVFVTDPSGEERGYVVDAKKALSNQEAFLLNVPRLLTGRALARSA